MDNALTRTFPSNLFGSRLFGDELFGPGFLRTMMPEATQTRGWVPPVDIRETDAAYEVVAELPGMSKKDVHVTLENNVLTLAGERRYEHEESEGTVHRSERAYGRFSRSFTLPTRSDVNKVTATFKNGLLTLTVPKAEEARPRQIEIS